MRNDVLVRVKNQRGEVMSLAKILVSILLANLPVLLQVVSEPAKYFYNPNFWYLYLLYFLVTILYFYYSDLVSHFKFTKRHTDVLLAEFFEKIEIAAGVNSLVFIMRPSFNFNPYLGQDKFLKRCLFGSYPLDLEERLRFKIARPINIGIEGLAFKEDAIRVADFTEARKKGSHSWGMKPIDLKLMGEFKSGIAVPIEDPQIKHRVIGVLTIYSHCNLNQTPFRGHEFQDLLVKTNKLISVLIKGAR